MNRDIWWKFRPGTVFQHNGRVYLRTDNLIGGLVTLDNFSGAWLPDVEVEPIGSLEVIGDAPLFVRTDMHNDHYPKF